MSETPQELLQVEVEQSQNRRRAALVTIDRLAADHGVTLPAPDEEPYPCNRIALLVRAIADRADKAEAALRERSGSAHWDAIEDRLKRAEAALRRYVERDHSEALVLDAQRERDYQTHGPWCRCVDCVRLWPTAYKLPVRVALRAVPERRP